MWLDTAQTCDGHGLDMAKTCLKHASDMVRIWPKHDLVFFFQLFDGPKKIQKPKNLSLFRNLFFLDVNKNSTPYFLKRIEKIQIIYIKNALFFERDLKNNKKLII